MKAFMGALILVALAAQSVQSAEFTPEQVQQCLQQAEVKAEGVWILPKMEEIFQAKSVRSLSPKVLPLFFNECKDIIEKAHFAQIENDCAYDLEKLLDAGKVQPLEKLGHVLAIRDYCLATKKDYGILGKYLIGDAGWFTEMLNKATGGNLLHQ